MLVSARGVVDLNGRISEWLQLAARRMCALKHDACMCSRRPWYMRQCDCLTRPVNVLVLAMVCCEEKAVAVFFSPATPAIWFVGTRLKRPQMHLTAVC